MSLLLLLPLLLLTTATSVLFEDQTYNREPEVSEVSDLISAHVETWSAFKGDPLVRLFRRQ